MGIPPDAVIIEKLTGYLLVAREWDDKVRELAAGAEAVEDGANEYGTFLRAEGALEGPNGRSLAVVTIWLRSLADGRVRFVTMKPKKEEEAMSLRLYDRVALKSDIPEHGLRRGDVAVLVDYVPHPEGGEQGCVLEVFNALGESLAVVAVSESEIEGLRPDEILAVRPLAKAV